jgi:hypothetical protein
MDEAVVDHPADGAGSTLPPRNSQASGSGQPTTFDKRVPIQPQS